MPVARFHGVEPGSPEAHILGRVFSAQIKQFYLKAAQAHALGNVEISRRQFQVTDALRMQYTNVQGQEIIHIRVAPALQREVLKPKPREIPDYLVIDIVVPEGIASLYEFGARAAFRYRNAEQTWESTDTGGDVQVTPAENQYLLQFAYPEFEWGLPIETLPTVDYRVGSLLVDMSFLAADISMDIEIFAQGLINFEDTLGPQFGWWTLNYPAEPADLLDPACLVDTRLLPPLVDPTDYYPGNAPYNDTNTVVGDHPSLHDHLPTFATDGTSWPSEVPFDKYADFSTVYNRQIFQHINVSEVVVTAPAQYRIYHYENMLSGDQVALYHHTAAGADPPVDCEIRYTFYASGTQFTPLDTGYSVTANTTIDECSVWALTGNPAVWPDRTQIGEATMHIYNADLDTPLPDTPGGIWPLGTITAHRAQWAANWQSA